MAPSHSWLERIALVIAAAALAAGCAGSIDDPASYYAASGGCPSDFDVERDLFARSCGGLGCHASEDSAAGLDLVSEGVGARLRAHSSGLCDDRPLLVAGDPGGSFFFEKLEEEPSCGERMPMGRAPLGPTEQVCLEQYLEALIGAPSGEGASDAGVGGDAGGNQ